MSSTDIVVYMDYVVILGVRVDRPTRISRSEWLSYWGMRYDLT
jgi:hypothetical protein